MSRIKIEGETSHPKEIIARDVVNAVIGRLAAIKETLKSIDADLATFHKKYKYSDEEFLDLFNKGELGDSDDFFAWEGSLRLRKQLVDEDAVLREVL
nr:hypothetical protein [Candidatus Sigynarchaeum springense]